jgi:flagellar biosynthesis protein FliQ
VKLKKEIIFGTTQLIPSIITTNCQETLVAHWMLEAIVEY